MSLSLRYGLHLFNLTQLDIITMTTQAKSPVAQPTQPQRHTIGSTFSQLLGATSSIIAAVDNTAKVAEHVTGTLADKAENWRDSSRVIDAINHNQLMATYNDQAKQLGISDF